RVLFRSEVGQHAPQQRLARRAAIADERGEGTAIELLHHDPAQRRLSRPEIAGEHYETAAIADRGQQLLAGGVVRSTVIEEPRIGRKRARLFAEAIETFLRQRIQLS